MTDSIEKIGVNDYVINRFTLALDSDRKFVRDRAIEAIGRLCNCSHLDSLYTFLGSNDEDVIYSTIEAIGRIATRESVKPNLDLLHPLLSSKRSRIVAVTAETLGYIASRDSLPYLLEELKNPAPNVEILSALEKINDPSTLMPLCEYILRFDLRRWADRHPYSIKDRDRRTAYMIKRLSERDKTDEMRSRGVSALSALNDPRAIPYLIQYMKKCDTDHKVYAARAIAQLGNINVVPFLRSLFSFRNGAGYKSIIPVNDRDINKHIKSIHEESKPRGYVSSNSA
jgi:HEAT repeat protein